MVGSVVLVAAACAFAAGVIGGLILATTGAVGLSMPATVTILGGWTVGFVAVSTMVGGAVGFAAGSGMATSDICAYSNPGWNFGTESCSI